MRGWCSYLGHGDCRGSLVMDCHFFRRAATSWSSSPATSHILWPHPPAALVSSQILELTKSFLTPGLSTCHSPWSEMLFLWPNSQPSILSPNLTRWWMTCLISPSAYVYFTSTLHFSTKARIKSINQWILKISLVPSSPTRLQAPWRQWFSRWFLLDLLP